MGSWEENEVRARFMKRAAELEARVPPLKARVGEGAAMRVLHDEALAKLVVYRVLLDGTVLRSREEMLGTLVALRRDPPASPEALEPAGFGEVVRQFADALIGQYRS